MNTNKRSEDKQLKLFFMIAFGMPVVMGLLMGYGYSQKANLMQFSMTHMYYPAAGVMVAMLFCQRKTELLPKTFFICYLAQTVLAVGLSIFGLVTRINTFMVGNLLIVIGSVLLLIILFRSKKEARAAFGLKQKKLKTTLVFVCLFLALYTLRMVIAFVYSGELSSLLEILSQSDTWVAFLTFTAVFVITFVPYFGEEYGWRYFLQPLLQRRFGPIKGILLLGFLWGSWHLPVNFFLYTSPAYGFISVTNQVIVCLAYGIFYGYIYMKTDNIWSVTLIHYMNNNFGGIFSGDPAGENAVGYSITWEVVLFMAVTMTIIYAWPILTKYYRSRKFLSPTPDARIDEVAYELAKEGRSSAALGSIIHE